MKKNAMSNQMIDLYLTLEGVTLKACDFEDDNNIKTMIRRRPHTVAEKYKADAKERVSLTGKKRDRSRRDYKTAKVMKAYDRSYNRYDKGGYDRNGIIQNRRNIEATKDAMNDIYGKDDADRDTNYFVSLVEAKESLEVYINRLELEYDEVDFMEHQFREWAMNTARTHHFEFRPIVKIDSYVSEALNNARASLAELEDDIDKLRKGVM